MDKKKGISPAVSYQKALRVIAVFAFLLTFLTVFNPGQAWAKTDHSDSATSLQVYLVSKQGAELVHTYSMSEMESLSRAEPVSYSSIDALPICVYTVAQGVYLSDLLDDAKSYNKDLAFKSGGAIKLHATDKWTQVYTYKYLFGSKRYYYPELFTTWDLENGLAGDGADDIRIQVDPMFAVISYQKRIDDNSDPTGKKYDEYVSRMDGDETFRFCMGMTDDDLEPGVSTTAKYGRWVYRMDVILPEAADSEGNNNSVTGITLDHETAEVKVGKNVQLTATIIPNDASEKRVTWVSSNTSVATVDSDGLVTGVGVGTAEIKATAKGNTKESKTCIVTVTGTDNVSVTGVSLNKTSSTIALGGTTKLSALVTPSNATNRNVTWGSSNSSVATVAATDNSSALVTAKTVGTTTITVTTASGGKTATCTVTVVKDKISVTSVSLDKTSLNLKKNETKQLKATLSPSNATNSYVSWGSNHPAIATVDPEGWVTGKGKGTAIITVMTEDGGKTATCTVTVTETNSSETTTGKNNNTNPGTTPVQQSASSVFKDISGTWAEENIKEMVNFGILSGYEDGRFKPDGTVTRAEFVTMVIKALQKTGKVTIKTDKTFADTDANWAKDYISTAVSYGIIDGYGDRTFKPNNKITREQMAVIIVRAFNLTSASAQTQFSDANMISSWASGPVSIAIENGVMTGFSGNKFAAQEKATRAQAATVILRVLKKTGYL